MEDKTSNHSIKIIQRRRKIEQRQAAHRRQKIIDKYRLAHSYMLSGIRDTLDSLYKHKKMTLKDNSDSINTCIELSKLGLVSIRTRSNTSDRTSDVILRPLGAKFAKALDRYHTKMAPKSYTKDTLVMAVVIAFFAWCIYKMLQMNEWIGGIVAVTCILAIFCLWLAFFVYIGTRLDFHKIPAYCALSFFKKNVPKAQYNCERQYLQDIIIMRPMLMPISKSSLKFYKCKLAVLRNRL